MAHNSSWIEWFNTQCIVSSMIVVPKPIQTVRGWVMDLLRGWFGRTDGKFFQMVGFEISVPKPGQREIPSWDQPLIQEVGEGALGLLKVRGEDLYLVSAKAEPGNKSRGRVLLAPSLQASRSNLEQAHGGTLPPRAEFARESGVKWVDFLKDGGRFFESTNQAAVIEVDYFHPNSNERWFSRYELREALLRGVCNAHLRELLALAFI